MQEIKKNGHRTVMRVHTCRPCTSDGWIYGSMDGWLMEGGRDEWKDMWMDG